MLNIILQGSDSLRNDSLIYLIILIFGTLFTLILGKIIKRVINFGLRKHHEIKNLLKIFTSLLQITVILSLLFIFFFSVGVDFEFLIGSAAIFATAIGIASTNVAYNVVAGLYIILTRPFVVGDMIRTQGIEGIVEEIGLNYTEIVQINKTKVRIPNANLVNTSLLNYSTEIQSRQVTTSKGSRPYSLWWNTETQECTRYRTVIELKLDVQDPPLTIDFAKKQLDIVCEEFTVPFGFRPRYYFTKYEFRLETNLVITAIDTYTIYNVLPFFLEAIVNRVYQALQVEVQE